MEALREIARRCRTTRVLVLTMHEDPAYLRSALAAGASGYLLKRAVDSELTAAIRAVDRGGTFVDPRLADVLVQDVLAKNGARAVRKRPVPILSDRELQVLKLVALGYTSAQIAQRIHVGVKTVETYRSRVAEKLELRSRRDLIRFAMQMGLLTQGTSANEPDSPARLGPPLQNAVRPGDRMRGSPLCQVFPGQDPSLFEGSPTPPPLHLPHNIQQGIPVRILVGPAHEPTDGTLEERAMMTMSRGSPSGTDVGCLADGRHGDAEPEAEPEATLAGFGVSGTVVRLEEDDLVFSQGGPADAVYYVQNGQVKLTVVSNTGKEAVLGLVSKGEFIGMSCLAAAPVRVSTATAVTHCVLLRIGRDVMTRALHRNNALAELFLEKLLARNVRAEADLVDQLLNSSEKRLARTLLLLAHVGDDATPATVTLRISQEVLAEMVGTTRARVSAFMNKFRQLGYVDYGGNDGLHVHRTLLNVVLR